MSKLTAILIMEISFLKVLSRRAFKKNDFIVFGAFGAGNNKISLIMGIAELILTNHDKCKVYFI
jgi:hypothetical protein